MGAGASKTQKHQDPKKSSDYPRQTREQTRSSRKTPQSARQQSNQQRNSSHSSNNSSANRRSNNHRGVSAVPGHQVASRASSNPSVTLISQRRTSESGPRVGTGSTSPGSEMPCASCSAQFSILSKKVKCDKCELMFCEACSLPIESTGAAQSTSGFTCLSCFVFRGPVLLRSQLVRLRVRDLVRQLNAKGVTNTRGCLTKLELVNLLADVPSVTLLMDDEAYTDSNPPSPRRQQETANGTNCNNGANRNNNNNGYSSSSSPPRTPANQQSSSSSSSDQHNHNNNNTVPNGSTNDAEHKPKERKQLSSIASEEDIDKLPVRELKEILVNNFVVIKGVCEKEELVQKAKMLWRQEIGYKKAAAAAKGFEDIEILDEDNVCKICMDAPINCVLLECGHMVACVHCGKKLSECPICRQYVVRAVHTFRT